SSSVLNNNNDVAANGDVVFASSPPYNIFRFRNGTTTQLTFDTNFSNIYPLTDGDKVVYRKFVNNNPQLHTTALTDSTGETVFVPLQSDPTFGAEPFRDYQVNNGWVAFTKGVTSGQLQ